MMDQPKPTAAELARHFYELNAEKLPGLRIAEDPHGTALAYWHETLGRWCTFVAHAITGEWVDYPYDMRVNGKPLIEQSDWREVPRRVAA